MKPNVLYPENYVEPATEAKVDGDHNGRNRERLLQLARGLVPEGGEPKTYLDFRDAVKGPDGDARCRSFTFSELRRVWSQVIAERKPTWTKAEPKAEPQELGQGIDK